MGKKHWADISGYCTCFLGVSEVAKLQELARGRTCLEIGSFLGKSTLCLAEVAKVVHTVDTFRASANGQTQMGKFTTLDKFKANIEGWDNIIYHIGKSADVIPKLDPIFDFAFIDGMHTYEDVKRDTELCRSKLQPHSIIAFHDYGGVYGGVKQAVDETFKEIHGPVRVLVWVYL